MECQFRIRFIQILAGAILGAAIHSGSPEEIAVTGLFAGVSYFMPELSQGAKKAGEKSGDALFKKKRN